MKKIILQSEDNNLVGTWTDGKWHLTMLGDVLHPKYGRSNEKMDAVEFEQRVGDAIARYDNCMKYLKADDFTYRKLES